MSYTQLGYHSLGNISLTRYVIITLLLLACMSCTYISIRKSKKRDRRDEQLRKPLRQSKITEYLVPENKNERE